MLEDVRATGDCYEDEGDHTEQDYNNSPKKWYISSMFSELLKYDLGARREGVQCGRIINSIKLV